MAKVFRVLTGFVLDAYSARLAANMVCVWFAFWAIRRKYEIDEKLDRKARIFRWTVVILGFAAAQLRGPEFAWVRVLSALSALAFLCWPNLARRLTGYGRQSDANSDFPLTPRGGAKWN